VDTGFEVGLRPHESVRKEDGYLLWDEWARAFPGLPGQKDQRYQWASFDKYAAKYTAGTLFGLATKFWLEALGAVP